MNVDSAAHELMVTRLVPVAREKLFRCWVEPELLVQWFTPPPWKTVAAVIDARAGGCSMITMHGPDGFEVANRGVYLEVVTNEKLVFTDAYRSAWIPSDKPFFTAVITFEASGGQTLYTARARHWTAEDCSAHAQMGFEAGWGIAADQLIALAATI